MSTRRDKMVGKAIEAAGGLTALANALGIRPQSIVNWRRIPPARVLHIERVTGISRHELRPDIYPREVDRPLAA